MKKIKEDIAKKFRKIRDSLNELVKFRKSIKELTPQHIQYLTELLDRKIEWILNILIIWFDDKKYPPNEEIDIEDPPIS